jgi:hypothetical protein
LTPLIDGEEFKDITGYEGKYKVSTHGRVWSCDRREEIANRHPKPYFRLRKGKFVSPRISNSGYFQVGLVDKRVLVHRLVAEAFIETETNKLEVNHKDGNKLNNHFSNLEWATRKENALHSTRTLKKNIGSQVASSALKEEQVLEIIELLNAGESQISVANKYGVTNHAIFRIQHGYNWSHITGIWKEEQL